MLNIFLELADAGDLADFILNHENNNQLVDECIIWNYVQQICSALQHMHSNRIMHRDLKPANIFLTSDGMVKLGDLGLSKYFSNSCKSAYSVLGSPYYMSPERLLHEKYYINSDIWSLGCIIYELAALRSPFYVNKLDFGLLIKKVIQCDYPPIPSDMYTNRISKIVEKCLSVNHDKRPSSLYVQCKAKKYLSNLSRSM